MDPVIAGAAGETAASNIAAHLVAGAGATVSVIAAPAYVSIKS